MAGEALTYLQRHERERRRRKYARYYQHDGGTKVRKITVPDDIERRQVHVPCIRCGAARRCNHRPWIGA